MKKVCVNHLISVHLNNGKHLKQGLMEKKEHGGKRTGSGRKPKDTVQLSLKIPTYILDGLNKKFTTIKKRNVEIIEVLKKLSK